jgi:putative transposase
MRIAFPRGSLDRVSRQPRCNLPDVGVFHVTNRGVDRQVIYRDDEDRSFFVALLQRAVVTFGLALPAYVLMSNHFHVVVMGELERLSRGMHYVSFRYAMNFNERHTRTGHLFQGRFGARSIEDDEYLERVCAYVLDNPVRAGICERFEDYRWLGGEWLEPRS